MPAVSVTAIRLAQAPVVVARDPLLGPLLPPDAAALNAALLMAAGMPRWRHRLLTSGITRTTMRWAERITMRGVGAHVALRKRWLTDQAQAALKAGLRQVLILGAGLDSLGMRLARAAPDARVFELDMPPTAAVKLRAVSLVGRPPNLRVVGARLGERPLTEVLDELPWDPSQRSLFVAEGLLTYLPEPAIDTLLATLRARSATGSRLLCTHLPGDDAHRPGGLDPLTTGALRLVGEPLRWGIAPAELGDFLGARGYRLLAAPTPAALCASYGLPPLEITVGERVAAADTVSLV